jgi:hypothetical protein
MGGFSGCLLVQDLIVEYQVMCINAITKKTQG